nr:unknown [Zea mays]
MIPGQGTPLTIEQSQKEEKTCLMVFDCRGYEPVEFSFGTGWKAESVHGTPFEIDCSEGEFSEYDEKGECPVELGKLQSTFKVVSRQLLPALPYLSSFLSLHILLTLL